MTFRSARTYLRNAGYLFSARALNIVTRAVYVVILARWLGPELYGIFAYGTSWYLAFLPFTRMGLDLIAAREVGRRSPDAASTVRDTFTLRLVSTLAVAVVCLLLGWIVEQDGLIRWLLSLFSIALIGRSLSIWGEGVFAAYEVTHYAFRLHLLFRLLEVVVGLFVLLMGGGIIAVVAVHAAVWWLNALVSFGVVRRIIGGRRLLSSTVKRLISLLVAGVPFGLVGVSESWLLNAPIVIFRHASQSDAELGQLSLLLQMLMVFTAFGSVIAKAALPALARAVERGDRRDAVFAEEGLRLSAMIGLAAWLTATAWGTGAVEVFFGSGFSDVGHLIGPVFALLYPFIGGVILANVLASNNATWSLVWVSLGSVALLVGLQPWLQEAFGMAGVVWAMAAAYFVWLTALVVLLRRLGRLRVGRSIAKPWLIIVVTGVLYSGLSGISQPIAYFAALAFLLGSSVSMGREVVAELSGSPTRK